MKDTLFTQAVLSQLIAYDARTGEMTWKERTPEIYQAVAPDIDPDVAAMRSERFNHTWAGKPVGTDRSNQGTSRRMRITFGPDTPTTRRLIQHVAWILGSGREPHPDREILFWDGDINNVTPENLVETTIHIRRRLENAASGLQQRESGRWQWFILENKVRYRGNAEGYATQVAAKEARDQALNSLGLVDITRLSDIMNGKD